MIPEYNYIAQWDKYVDAYVITCLEFPEIFCSSSDLGECIEIIKDEVNNHCEMLLKKRKKLPEVTNMQKMRDNEFIFHIDEDIKQTVKKIEEKVLPWEMWS